MKKILLLLLILANQSPLFAGEGMWLPLFLEQLNEKDMQTAGMKFTAADIYSVNSSSMKDGVVLFGRGCTAELISPEGLLLTNYHCGFGQIQTHSSVDHDYINNGFWSQSMKEEIPCPGLTVTFIIRMEEVTERVLHAIPEGASEAIRAASVKVVSEEISKDAIGNTHYDAQVKSFYNDNRYFLFVTEQFSDIRLVGSPPVSIGRFGGDTDNWMWPSQAGDFSMFRIYAGPGNKPAPYSAANVPYKPRYYFPISMKGIQPGDFTMVYGFPAVTNEYLPSVAVKSIVEVTDPTLIMIRGKKIELLNKAIASSDTLRIKYIAKKDRISNGWKKWQGEILGLKKNNTIAKKEAEEQDFRSWAAKGRQQDFIWVLDSFELAYRRYTPLIRASIFINEAAFGSELLNYVKGYDKLADTSSLASRKALALTFDASVDGLFNDISIKVDKELLASMMQLYFTSMDSSMIPVELYKLNEQYHGNFSKAANDIFNTSFFADREKLHSFLRGFNSKKIKQLKNDPLYKLARAFDELAQTKINDQLADVKNEIAILNRKYMSGRLLMAPESISYPDANSTLRVTYGKVEGYVPRDGVQYTCFSTLDGLIEKEDTASSEFHVPSKLKALYMSKDYGPYTVNGTVPISFLASNHTTGGNSGSPVINATGELIGINYDRVWEGTMSDLDYDISRCRNISLDIRYMLFIVDKFAGCTRLIDEMHLN
ncbi:MAG TPA: S46 family peptidase [Bacteroidia bacterium]|nr:S46 family peptidase [Bacteroidia bacterium]